MVALDKTMAWKAVVMGVVVVAVVVVVVGIPVWWHIGECDGEHPSPTVAMEVVVVARVGVYRAGWRHPHQVVEHGGSIPV